MRMNKQTILLGLLASVLVSGRTPITAHAEENVTFPQGVTWEMTEASYWEELAYEPDKLLMTKEEIVALNQDIVLGQGTGVVDLDNVKTTLDLGFECFNRDLYVNGNLISEDEYIQKFEEGKGNLTELLYAVAVKRADIKAWPTNEVIGYSATDPDDEIQMYALNVNEPAVIRAVCTVENEVFYFCQNILKTLHNNSCKYNTIFYNYFK